MKLSRRTALRMGLVGGVGLLLPVGIATCGSNSGSGGANVTTQSSAGSLLKSAAKLPEPFTVPLPIPPALEPTRSDATGDYYEITQRVGQAEIIPGLKTEI